jgi:hypothetical protein
VTRRRDCPNDRCWQSSPWHRAAGFLHSCPRWSPAGDAFVISLDHFKADEYVGGRIAVIRRTAAGWSKPKPITKVVCGPRADWQPTDDLIGLCTNDVGSLEVTDEPSNCSPSVPTEASSPRSPTTVPGRSAPASRPGRGMSGSSSTTSLVQMTSAAPLPSSTPTVQACRSRFPTSSSAKATGRIHGYDPSSAERAGLDDLVQR